MASTLPIYAFFTVVPFRNLASSPDVIRWTPAVGPMVAREMEVTSGLKFHAAKAVEFETATVECHVHFNGQGKEALLMETTVVDGTLEPTVPLYHKECEEFTSVVERRLPCFHRMALRQLGNMADAEDAVQDALLSAYAHLYQFKGKARLSTWLTTIVLNSARMKLRRRPSQLHVPLEHSEIQDTFFEALSDHRLDPEEACRRTQVTDAVARLSTRLSPALHRTFQLCDVKGLSIRETARLLRVPEGTVKARLARARFIVKHLMEKSFGGWRNVI